MYNAAVTIVMADFDWVHLIHADQWLELSLADIMLHPQVTPHCEPLKPFEGVVLKDPIPLRFFTVIETCVLCVCVCVGVCVCVWTYLSTTQF